MQISFPHSPSRQKSRAPDRAIVSLGYPILFHWTMLLILIGVLVFSAYNHLLPLLATSVFLLVLSILSWYCSRCALDRLSVTASISQDRAFPGEKVELTFELVNKGIPLTWIEIEIELPGRLVTGKKPLSLYTRKRLHWVTALSSGQVVTWKHTLEVKARGDYLIGPVRLRTGDMFGLFPKEIVLSVFQNLLVYPKIVAIGNLNIPLRALFGEKVATKSIYEDSSRLAGARDYCPDDPFKRIHWKASAAHGRLQSRQYESSTSLSLLLLLDLSNFPQEDEEFERAVSTVASMAYDASHQGFAFGLIANSEPELYIPLGNGRNHLMKILETLARVAAGSPISLYEHLDRIRASIPAGASLVVVSHNGNPALYSLARQMEQSGHLLVWIAAEKNEELNEPATLSTSGKVAHEG